MAIDGAPLQAGSAEELTILLAGPRNSTVMLRFERRRLDGALASLDRRVKRERVEEQTAVPAAFLLSPGTGYLRITTFLSDRVAAEVRSGLSRLEQQGMERLVLDLRDNGGGVVSQAASVAGEFLPVGAVVYTAHGRKAEVNDTVRVKRSFWKS